RYDKSPSSYRCCVRLVETLSPRSTVLHSLFSPIFCSSRKFDMHSARDDESTRLRSNTMSAFPLEPVGLDDMIRLDTLAEETILENLALRFSRDVIYVRLDFSSGFKHYRALTWY